MARARNIKPGIFKNEVLGTADPLLTILFAGLWTLADREGRLEDRPMRIKAEVFPLREGVDVNAQLDWLAANDFIERYEAKGCKYIAVKKFADHQRPHQNEPPSVIPAKAGTTKARRTSTIGESASENGDSTRAITYNPQPITPSLIPDSPSPFPDTPSLIPSTPEPRGDGFDRFWTAYPKKVAKPAAQKAWKKLNPNLELQQQIVNDLAIRVRCEQWTKDSGQFIPYPSTYLTGRRWEDELPGGKANKLRDEVIANTEEFLRRTGGPQ